MNNTLPGHNKIRKIPMYSLKTWDGIHMLSDNKIKYFDKNDDDKFSRGCCSIFENTWKNKKYKGKMIGKNSLEKALRVLKKIKMGFDDQKVKEKKK